LLPRFEGEKTGEQNSEFSKLGKNNPQISAAIALRLLPQPKVRKAA
jgi:hypothetical protein